MSLLSDLVPMGTSGYSGYSGYSGNSGSSGYSAYSGYSGYSAYSGTSGYSGYSGYSSTSGVSGYSAYSGVSGTSGYSGAVGSTPTTIDVTVTAGEALSARDCCYIALVTGGGLTAGRAYKADADTVRQSTQGFWCGFATAAISDGATGTVRVAGVLTGFTLTAGAPQYISATAGSITETAPTNSRLVGIALDTTNLLINTRGANTTVSSYGIKGYVLSTTAADCYIITYATDTSAAQTSLVEGTSNQAGTVSEGITKGYIAGAALAYKYTFSTNTSASSTASVLSTSRLQIPGMSANNAKGYFLGGTGPSAVTDKLTYSTDTTAASTASNLSSARNGARSVAQFNSHGYTAGGNTGAYVATTDKTTFSSDVTAAATTANLSEVKDNLGGVSEGNTKGYFAGGNTAAASNCSVIADKVTYSNDTTAAATTANLLVGRAWFATNSEGSTKGYWHAGYTNSLTYASTAQTDKTTFSTDVTAAATTANVTSTGWLSGMSDVAI